MISNRIVNGGFETGTLAPFTGINTAVVATTSHSGFFSALFTGGTVNAFIQQIVTASPNQSFELLVSLSKVGSAVSPPVSITVAYYDAFKSLLGYGLIVTIPAGRLPDNNEDDWSVIYQTASPAPVGTTQAVILINKLPFPGSSALLVDDVSLLLASAVAPECNAQAIGPCSFAVGRDTIALGENSHVEGFQTLTGDADVPTDGLNAHAEGERTIARGRASHAEGEGNIARGRASHAEGGGVNIFGDPSPTEAISNAAHAEGVGTRASGFASHAEGHGNIASGDFAHAEGGGIDVFNTEAPTEARGDSSHAEGLGTLASGIASHAEGGTFNITNMPGPIASGDLSHAEGQSTIAAGVASHAEGINTFASNAASHAEGFSTVAFNQVSHAEGIDSFASGLSSHAEGNSFAGGEASHAEGISTIAGDDASHAEGFDTIAARQAAHAEGSETTANGVASHAEGSNTFASGVASHAEGILTSAFRDGSHAEGIFTIANNEAAHAEGQGTVASGVASHAEGGSLDEFSVGSVASGAFSHAEGANTIATQIASHAEGFNSFALGNAAHAEGSNTRAMGTSSHTEGQRTMAIRPLAHAEGNGTIAAGVASHAEGQGTFTEFVNSHIMGRFGGANEAHSWFVANGTSEDAPALSAKLSGPTGNLFIRGRLFQDVGGDYAEMFETADGNPIDVGYFVTAAREDKIRKATATDRFILGVTSSNPSIQANSASLHWHGRFVTDEWGRMQFHEVTLPEEIDDFGNVIMPETKEIQPVINPDWNPKEAYIPRTERPEWVAVGLIGQVLVRDDGTCVPHGFCMPNNDGVATAAGSGYFVLKRTGERQIVIVLK